MAIEETWTTDRVPKTEDEDMWFPLIFLDRCVEILVVEIRDGE